MALPTPPRLPPSSLFRRPGWPEARHIAAALRTETIGGGLLIGCALAAVVWANTPWASVYFALRQVSFGPAALQLHLTLAQWAADGLLALFFFLAGLELKHEFVLGDLSDPVKAVVPVAAAVCGVIVPAGMFVAIVYETLRLSGPWRRTARPSTGRGRFRRRGLNSARRQQPTVRPGAGGQRAPANAA